jgi:actin-like ATPase involved in cell morphogenesis
MGYHLGVDLGTTYTAAALARGQRAEAATLGTRSVSIPSVVYLGAGSGGEEMLIGEAAVRRATAEPARVAREFKRRVGDPTPLLLGGTPVGAELLMGRLLAWVVKQVAATEGEPPTSLAVTHPANWGEYKLDLLRQAIRHVGLTVDHLVPEPVAAASFYASQRDLAAGATVAVYDLGGGTFDAALVRIDGDGFHIVGRPDGIERMGGIDFDHAVFRHVVGTLGLDVEGVDADDPGMAAALAQLRTDCVEAKEALSSDTDVSIPVLLPTHHTEVRLTRQELEAMIRPALDETVVALRRTIASAGFGPADITAVLLVGGSSRIPLVGQLVAAELGRPIAIDARPKDAISLGAALVAARHADEASAAPAAANGAAAAAAALATGAAATPSADATATTADAAPPAAPTPSAPRPAAPAGPTRTPLPPPPLYPPAVATTPGRGVPSQTGAGAGGGRAWWVAAAAVVVAVAAVTALLVTRGDGDPEEGDLGGGQTTETTGGTDTTEPPDQTTSTSDPLGGIDLGGLGTDTGSGEPLEPLPGDDWNPDARVQFVEECQGLTASAAAITGADPSALCGCAYDDIAASGLSLAEFNEMWAAEGDIDTTSPAAQGFQNAVLGCGTSVAAGG